MDVNTEIFQRPVHTLFTEKLRQEYTSWRQLLEIVAVNHTEICRQQRNDHEFLFQASVPIAGKTQV